MGEYIISINDDELIKLHRKLCKKIGYEVWSERIEQLIAQDTQVLLKLLEVIKHE